jgi:hypothetical protein
MTMSEDDERSEAELELREAIEFGVEQTEAEVDAQPVDVPEHGGRLLVGRATDAMQAIANIQMLREREDQEDPEDDYVKDKIEESLVDVLLAVGSIAYEYDLRVADAFERRKDFIEDFNNYEDALEDAETDQERVNAFEEHMSDHAEQMNQGPSVSVGDNVDEEDYDPDHRDRHIQ